MSFERLVYMTISVLKPPGGDQRKSRPFVRRIPFAGKTGHQRPAIFQFDITEHGVLRVALADTQKLLFAFQSSFQILWMNQEIAIQRENLIATELGAQREAAQRIRGAIVAIENKSHIAIYISHGLDDRFRLIAHHYTDVIFVRQRLKLVTD